MKWCVKPLGPQSLGHPSSPAMTKPSQPAATWRIYMIIYIYIFVYTQLHNVCVYHMCIYICINYILPQKRGFLDSAQLCRNFPRTTFSCQTTGFGLRHGPTGERFQPSKELAD